jgi:hypothetical protein
MTTEMWLIAAARLLGSVPVLRWAFVGALIAMVADQSDLFMMNLIDLGGVSDYQTFDKYLDQAYLVAFLVVAVRWRGPARGVAVVLYAYRLAGLLLFELTHERDLLLLFPNFFEYWFVLIAALAYFGRLPPGWEIAAEAPPRREACSGAGDRPASGPTAMVAMRTTAVSQGISAPAFGVIIGALIALKLFQEYALHYGRWLDGFTAVEAVRAVWYFLIPPY